MESKNVPTKSSTQCTPQKRRPPGNVPSGNLLHHNSIELFKEQKVQILRPGNLYEKNVHVQKSSPSTEIDDKADSLQKKIKQPSNGCENDGYENVNLFNLFFNGSRREDCQNDNIILCKASPVKEERLFLQARGSMDSPYIFSLTSTRNFELVQVEQGVGLDAALTESTRKVELQNNECSSISNKINFNGDESPLRNIVQPSDESENEGNESPDMFDDSLSEHSIHLESNICLITPIKQKRQKQRLSRNVGCLFGDGVPQTPRRSFEGNPRGRRRIPRNLSQELDEADDDLN